MNRASEDDEILERLIGQMTKATARASAAIEDALAFVAASDTRIAALEARRPQKLT